MSANVPRGIAANPSESSGIRRGPWLLHCRPCLARRAARRRSGRPRAPPARPVLLGLLTARRSVGRGPHARGQGWRRPREPRIDVGPAEGQPMLERGGVRSECAQVPCRERARPSVERATRRCQPDAVKHHLPHGSVCIVPVGELRQVADRGEAPNDAAIRSFATEIRSSVDLPAPLAPTSPIRLPASTRRSTASSTFRGP